MKLAELISSIDNVQAYNGADTEIESVVYDSRQAKLGALFVTVKGNRDNGSYYINDAINRGAVAILTDDYIVDCAVAQVVVKDARLALLQAARAFYGVPAQKIKLLGVTGTNGKTTVAYIVRHIIRTCGYRCGMLGTVEYDLGNNQPMPAPLTTPQSADFQRYLDVMVQNDTQYAIAEVSSHALSQNRVYPSDVCCAIYTNLSRDHLDYHGSMENYLLAKKLLFSGLDAEATAVVNSFDVYGRLIVDDTPASVVFYGFEAGDDFRITDVEYFNDSTRIMLNYKGDEYRIDSPLVGEYNVLNVVGALAGVVSCGIDIASVVEAIGEFEGVPGRLERVGNTERVCAFVDYAHTPDALEKALRALRPLLESRLHLVFGCGGDRDVGKRSQMGRVACELADCVYITSDNPRSEKPEKIIQDIIAGCYDSDNITVELDRQKAISMALSAAREGDIVLVAGKGHEDYQIIGDERLYFDDRQVIKKFLNSIAG